MKLKITIIAVCLCLFNCKTETKKETQTVAFDYKFPSVEKLVDCPDTNSGLYQEAVQSFEEDLANFYTPETPVLSRAYSLFVSQALANKADYKNIVSDHSKKVLEALKQEKGLWKPGQDGSNIDFSHPIFKCIANRINDEPLRKTFSALVDTNSMSLRMFGDQLRRKTFGMKDDKYLATYVALELYYGRLYDMDLSKDAANTEEPIQNDNTDHDSHDGHNH
ncbi:hypothetical protein [Psychroserpens sp. Hel_I_66]|uniref:hypothetical protein n=1 Tax=Psychroserpens sp. Hel_I_66 TaxID=1250004 RepID=UPI000648EA18|nr:hypothetical protein [Psychroserpens sp. Hel_I_66]